MAKEEPYPKTWHPRYRSCVTKMMEEVIHDPHAPLFDIIKKERVVELLKEERPIPWYGQLMTTPQTIAYLVQMNYWLQTYKSEDRRITVGNTFRLFFCPICR